MIKLFIGIGVAFIVSSCSFAPTYHAPVIAIETDEWQDNLWKMVTPEQTPLQQDWWLIFNDATLNELENKIEQTNPDLAAALARYDQAIAYTRQLQAGLGPTVDAGANFTDNRQSDNRPLRGANQPNVYDANTVGLSINYALDMWGQLRNMVAAGKAGAQASAADMEAIKLSLQAELAINYINLRGVDGQIQIINDAITAYTRALTLTQNRYEGGVASGIDVARAKTQLSSVRSKAADLAAQRAIYEHAIASLIGQPAMNFSLPVSEQPLIIPEIPLVLPSELLLRRPDISAAERRTAAANATIGVARAAYFPSFSLGATYGFQNTGQSGLFTSPNSFWSIGPAVAFNLIDFGLRNAELAEAYATLDIASANYRSLALAAFQQVEDNLSLLKYGKQGSIEQEEAVISSNRAVTLAMHRYREGAVNYLEVVTAQETALDAAQRALDLQTLQLKSSVELIRTLGGGWGSEDS